MKDAYSFDLTDEGLNESYQRQRDAYERIFTRLGLEYVIVAATSGAMGGSRSEEFLTPTTIGEDTFVRAPSGYAANVEAVVTAVPESVDFSDTPAARVVDTPNTGTIEELVAHLNAHFPREDGREWNAGDTLKNVVVVATDPEGNRELLVIGVPGDRDVDMKRLEASLAPREVEPAGDGDFAKNKVLVKGYIGPQVLGQTNTGDDTAIRYLVDPRVVSGTRWVTGANADGQHVIDLVMDRDFVADATIEAAQVLAGDPAPDGSGPLELARGIEIGHIFQLGRKYAEALGLKVLDESGKQAVVTMGSYGIGVSRVMAALAEANHDDKGLAWPAHVAPAHVHIVATGKDEAVFEAAEKLGQSLSARGVEVIYDDRPKVSPGVKFKDAELYGVPFIVVVGRGLADGVIEFRERVGESQQIAVDDAVNTITAAVAAKLAE
jgi:prolyl-tRNA synthetase